MNRVLVTLILLTVCTFAFAQDTPPITNKPNLNPGGSAMIPKLFSANPTANEIASVLESAGNGAVEPMRVVQELIAGGSSLVPVLADVIAPDSLVPPSQPGDSGKVRRPALANRVLLIYALDGIGSADAYSTIMRIGAPHPDAEIKGASMNALVHTYLAKVRSGALKPDCEVVHALVARADDPAFAKSLGRSVAWIAREGIRSWLNWDLGVFIRFQYKTVVNAVAITMPSAQYWEYWWSQNKPKIAWADNLGRFSIAN